MEYDICRASEPDSPLFANNSIYSAYWKDAQKLFDSPPSKIPSTDAQLFQKHRSENIRLFAYSTYVISEFLDNYPEGFCYALFDADGCLFRLLGSETMLQALADDGITAKTSWKLENIGPNAVTVGLAAGCQMSTVGMENYALPLQKYALYFAPVTLQNDYPPHALIENGGIAIFVPAEQHRPEYSLLAFSLANNIMVNIHFLLRNSQAHDAKGLGVLFLDISFASRKVTINHYNQKLFEILDIPPCDIAFRPVEVLFDPPPKNQDFWSIIQKRKYLRDHEITLSVQGKEVRCILSSDINDQPSLHVLSVVLSLTTAKEISSSVAQKMGNGAVRTFDDIIGSSAALRTAIDRARVFAQTDSNVMLLGESGVGKDIFAQAIHNGGSRRGHPFITVNCGALPRDLIASELFGYGSGAFTGAKRSGNIGKFELANGGTIFLDEIGELPLDLQATLLRAVEQKEFMPLGSSKVVHLDVRIICATNADVITMMEQKQFRADLYYRLCTMSLEIPPLRERGNDPILLANYFIQKTCMRIRRPTMMSLSPEAQQLLLELPWQGNVRELQNMIENIVQLYPGERIMRQYILDYRKNTFGSIRSSPTVSSPLRLPKKTPHRD